MQHEKKLIQQEQQQVSETQSQTQVTKTTHEFASPEELLRFDAKRTEVPAGIAQRLSGSLENEPVVRRSWWKRWFQ
jgi:hypothetical protein